MIYHDININILIYLLKNGDLPRSSVFFGTRWPLTETHECRNLRLDFFPAELNGDLTLPNGWAKMGGRNP
jgi:hypothetical protein